MGENARSQTLGVIGNNVVKRACDKRGRPIGARMTKGERNSHDSEREPVKFAKWNSLEMFVDNKAKQEKYLAASGEELAKREQSQEQNHWQDVGQELPAMRLHFGFRNGIVIFPRCLRKRTPARRRWRARSNWSWRRSDCTGNAAAKNIERYAF